MTNADPELTKVLVGHRHIKFNLQKLSNETTIPVNCRHDLKFSNRTILANIAESDLPDQGLHCLELYLHKSVALSLLLATFQIW